MKMSLLWLCLTAFGWIACDAPNQQSAAMVATASPTAGADRIEVLDFHSDHRCRTCVAIERLTRQTLDAQFADEMASGKITFRLINVDEAENQALAEQYQASGSALMLRVVREGGDTVVDLTDMAFMNAGQATQFSEKLSREISTYF